jgi:glycolate oxidase iron-sulfur subunit
MPENNSPQKCILCGRCLEVCPVFRVTDREELSPRGKSFLIEHYQDFDLVVKSVNKLTGICAGCNKCMHVCPREINLPLEIARLKSLRPDWKSWIWSRMLKSGISLLPAIKGGKAIIPGTVPFLKHSLPAKPPVPPLLKALKKTHVSDARAAVFPGCLGKHFRPELEKKSARLLTLLGYETIEAPEWQCCGFPLGSAGLFEQEKKEILRNIDLWDETGRPLIFVFCATCLDGLKNPFCGPVSHDLWECFRQSIKPLHEHLSGLELVPANPHETLNLVWHEPCHGSKDSGKIFQDILSTFALDISFSNNKCCGMGGSLAIQNPGLSSMIARDFWQDIPQKDNSLILTSCSGCVLQLDSTSPDFARVAHWLEIFSTYD